MNKRLFLYALLCAGSAWTLQHHLQRPVVPSTPLPPTVQLYRDRHCQQPYSVAVGSNRHYFTLPQDAALLPDTLYRAPDVPLQLQQKWSWGQQQQLALFAAATGPSGTIAAAASQQLQLIPSQQRIAARPAITATYQQQQLQLSAPCPAETAFVLCQHQQQLLPFAIYQRSTDQLYPLQQFRDLPQLLQPAPQDLYVLENDFIQLVFSKIGGAIVEINLPFASKNRPSIVQPIAVDHQIARQSPSNARFPLQPAAIAGGQQQPACGGYYPLLRRGHGLPPDLYACNIVSATLPATTVYSLQKLTAECIEFEARDAHRRIKKRFRLLDAPYSFDLSIEVEGDRRDLRLTSGLPEVELIGNNAAPALKYRSQEKGRLQQLPLPKAVTTLFSIAPQWVCNSNGFFALITTPLAAGNIGWRAKRVAADASPSRLALVDALPAVAANGYATELLLDPAAEKFHFRSFAGPLDQQLLQTLDASGRFDYAAAAKSSRWLGFISEPCAALSWLLMQRFHRWSCSWGISIILLTVVLKCLLYPLSGWSIRTSHKMQALTPTIIALQRRYSNDPQRLQREMLHLYRQHRVNPLLGCLPTLIQMPFLLAMFDLLKSTFALRGAPFVPGWIDNLIAPDILYRWKAPLPFLGNELHLLPILVGLSMYMQQRLAALAKDFSPPTAQQKAFGNLMLLLFTLLFYHFPSGLNIYWLSSNLLSILQQIVILRQR